MTRLNPAVLFCPLSSLPRPPSCFPHTVLGIGPLHVLILQQGGRDRHKPARVSGLHRGASFTAVRTTERSAFGTRTQDAFRTEKAPFASEVEPSKALSTYCHGPTWNWISTVSMGLYSLMWIC